MTENKHDTRSRLIYLYFFNTKPQAEKGFTLIELLVVITIIGILSSVVLTSLNSARAKSRDARRVSDIGQIRIALEFYFDDNGTYPASLADLVPAYIPSQSAPADPLDGIIYPYARFDNGTEYHLGANLEGDGHSALSSDRDLDDISSEIDGGDDNGCDGEVERYCYDVTP